MMTSLYDWLKKRWRASQAITCEAPSPRTLRPHGRPLGGLTETDYLLLFISSRAWP
jgi:hypothetical protein